MKRNAVSTIGPRIVRGVIYWILLMAVLTAGCGDNAPAILPETINYMPPELKDIYLGMEKAEVDKYFTAHSTQLTNRGLETATQFVKDSVRIGVAFSYRDGRLLTVTIWYDYELVPERVDAERREFLNHLLETNGLGNEPCSFVMDEGQFVPDLGLIWKHPGCMAVATFSKSGHLFPDTLTFRPYHQYSIFGPPITPWHLWKNIIIPAPEEDRPYFREVDSLRSLFKEPGTM